jgi:hypothetical protein
MVEIFTLRAYDQHQRGVDLIVIDTFLS